MRRAGFGMSLTLLWLFMVTTPLPVGAAGGREWCGTSRWGTLGAVWSHQERAQRLGADLSAAAPARPAADADVGEIAVLEDAGDLVLPRNFLDLQGALLEFAPQRAGYRVIRSDRPLSPDPGTTLALGDDDSRRVPLPFAFPFYGESWSEVFVNSDGNLSFGSGDSASSARSLGRFLAGPPRVAPLFADFDPAAGGRVETRADADRFTVSWREVPQFGQADRNSFQVVLHRSGRVEFVYDRQLNGNLEEGVVGLAPGRSRGRLTALDLSQASGASGSGALAESFRSEVTLDAVAVARRFYKSHGDDFQQLVVFTSRRAVPSGTFAYELTVRQSDRGIGSGLFDQTAQFGSAGRLESFVVMDFIGKYPSDPSQVFLGADSALGILAHETGHRWLAQATFQDGSVVSRELLGRAGVHWSFFVDTDASHLEGNDIQDLGGGQFQTLAAGQRYGPLDQYLMGIRAPEEVPAFFFVRSPSGTDTDPARDPEAGVSFGGTRRDVTLAEVLAAIGPRDPAAGARPEPWRQAFLFVSLGPPDPRWLERIERLRADWPGYFARSTDGRWAVDPLLSGRRRR